MNGLDVMMAGKVERNDASKMVFSIHIVYDYMIIFYFRGVLILFEILE